MKITKSQRSNIIFVIILAILFFTPLGGMIKEVATKLLSFAPSTVAIEKRVELTNYNWNLKGINTNDLKFNDAKGQVVIVNFWATWCPPCRAEMPSLQELYSDYKDDVMFIFLTNEEEGIVKGYLDKNNYNLPSYNQYTAAPKEFNVSSIPRTFVIDRNGFIVVDKTGAADWDSRAMRDLLDELLQK